MTVASLTNSLMKYAQLLAIEKERRLKALTPRSWQLIQRVNIASAKTDNGCGQDGKWKSNGCTGF